MKSYVESVRESRLDESADDEEWRLICFCSVNSASKDMIIADDAEVSVLLVEENHYENEKQIGRLSQPQADDGRVLAAYIQLEKDEFLRFVDFIRTYSQSCVFLELGIWSSEVSESDIHYGKWDKQPILDIQTFSYIYNSART